MVQLDPKGWPDVGALTGGPANYEGPPLLRHSWTLIAPREDMNLIPPAGSYAARIAPALSAVRPWLVWDRKRMLEAQGPLQIDSACLHSLWERVHREATPSPMAELIRQTSHENFTNLSTLAGSWGMPQSSLGPMLSGIYDPKSDGPPEQRGQR